MAKLVNRRRWSFKNEIFTLFYAFRDDRTPWYAKMTSIISVIYLLSPADIVPDIIPLAGYIDDLFVVPFLVNISTRLLPADVKRIAEAKAKRKSRTLTVALIAGVIVVIALLVLLFIWARNLYTSW